MNVQQLMDAVEQLNARDALQCKLSLDEWKALAPYLSVRFMRVGDPLMFEGDADREVYILAEGEVEVRIQDHALATLGAGNVVGEGTFFSGEPRSATVVPTKTGVAWGLKWDRFEALSKKHPGLAIDLLKGLAIVLAIRMRQAVLVEHFA
ncbi:MAG TPA: cyclic nucleotide-binding domain-containing protein [Ramlibacter sp.]|uniref:Crp/Fnr family transcriptional regulator n=1 Tax=Ramlibacter sp. TaxID=1917967 RepID=UPI002C4498D4|nr:cyclic nucleotide-binding domain-containing protein [Ramlibacter sp.]HVZ46939.1 cyclic nucleotide-binding domain-containing protein [Ramlibacter sp.]